MPTAHPITRVTEEDVGRLDALELVKVTHKLLLCEARRLGVERPNLYSTTRINVGDGGRDLGWNNPITEPVAYIPRDKTFYQSKASKLDLGVIRDEILNKKRDAIKPRVAEVLLHGGAYVFVTTDSWIRKDESLDIHEITREALATVGAELHPDSKVEVLGREKMAEWINHYPSVIAHVLRVTCGYPDIHFFDVEAWGQNPEMDGSYIETPALLALRDKIRKEALSQVGSVFRLTGLSGLGKTRLAYELVRKHHESDDLGKQLEAATVYFNYGDHQGSALNLLLGLSSSGFEGIVIVDDCPPDIHRSIQNRVGGRRITILTLYHEPEPKAENSFILTPEDNKEVVIEILRKDPRSSVFSADQLKRIADFGEGFPEIARMMLDQSLVPTDRLLSETEIAPRLLGDGTRRDLVREDVFGAHCLFRRIGGDETKLREQTRFLEETFLADVRSSERITHRERLQSRGLLKLIGDIRLTAPRPLAVAFCIRKFESINPNEWPDLVQKIEDAGLLESFCQRVSEMEVSQQRNVIGERISQIFPLQDPKFLGSKAGGGLFRAVALMNPGSALHCLREAVESEIYEDYGAGWENVMCGLRDIAWHSSYFLVAARLVLRFATTGPSSIRIRAAEYFANFYHIALSGTQKPAMERIEVLREVFSDNQESAKSIAINALGAALQDRNFYWSSDMSLTGIGDPHLHWYPCNYGEIEEYQNEAFRILGDLVLNHESHAAKASEMIASGLGCILTNDQLLQDLDSLFKQLADSKNKLWPEVKNQIQLKLERKTHELASNHRESLGRWLGYVTPDASDFENRYRDLVGNSNHHYVENADGSLVNVSQTAVISLAEEFLQTPFDLLPFVDLFLTGPQSLGFDFSKRLAGSYAHIDELLDEMLARWPTLPSEDRNPAFICGIVSGFATEPLKRRVVLDRIASTPGLIDLLLYASTANPLEIEDVRRIRMALTEKRIDPSKFNQLGYGGITSPLIPAEFMAELDLMLDGRPEMVSDILHVLSMYCYDNPERFRQTSALFKKIVIHPLIQEAKGRYRYDWKTAAIRLVMLETNEPWYQELARNILSAISTSYYSTYSNGEYVEVFRLMLNRSPQSIAPIITEALKVADHQALSRLGEFLSNANGFRDESGSPLWELPSGDFQIWLRQNPRLAPVLLKHMPLIIPDQTREQEDDSDLDLDPPFAASYAWHPHSKVFLEEGIGSSKILMSITSKLLFFGSSGSRVPYLEDRKRIVQGLLMSDDNRLTSIARELSETIDREIELERRFDLNESAEFM